MKILVADDDQAMLRLYARIFTGEDYSVTMAPSFTEASGLIRSGDYDLLVTDLMFPDGLGTELIRLFESKRAGARSLLVTGSVSAGGSLDEAGRAECIKKPFKVAEFMATVTRTLEI